MYHNTIHSFKHNMIYALCSYVGYGLKLILVVPYDDINLGQHWRKWLIAWWHQGITWTNVDLSSKVLYGIHLKAVSQEMPKISIYWIILKITLLELQSHRTGSNELTQWICFFSVLTHLSLGDAAVVITLLMLETEYSGFRGQYHACWCTGY